MVNITFVSSLVSSFSLKFLLFGCFNLFFTSSVVTAGRFIIKGRHSDHVTIVDVLPNATAIHLFRDVHSFLCRDGSGCCCCALRWNVHKFTIGQLNLNILIPSAILTHLHRITTTSDRLSLWINRKFVNLIVKLKLRFYQRCKWKEVQEESKEDAKVYW